MTRRSCTLVAEVANCRAGCSVFHQVGECAYVVTDADAFNAAGGLDESCEYEACEVGKGLP